MQMSDRTTILYFSVYNVMGRYMLLLFVSFFSVTLGSSDSYNPSSGVLVYSLILSNTKRFSEINSVYKNSISMLPVNIKC